MARLLARLCFLFAESTARRSGRDFLTRVRRAPAALPALFHPSRLLLWPRLVFVLAVYFGPSDIVGALKAEEERPSSLEARKASGRLRVLWPQLSSRREPRLPHMRNTRANC